MLERVKRAFLGLFEGLFLPVPPSVRALARRVEALEEDLEALSSRHRKLAGRVDGARGGRAAAEAVQDPPTPDPDQISLDELSAKIMAGEITTGGFRRVRVS